MKTLALRLKELRTKHNKTQKNMADYLEITPNAYQKYELSSRVLISELLIKLADYYDVSIDYLVGRTDNPNINK